MVAGTAAMRVRWAPRGSRKIGNSSGGGGRPDGVDRRARGEQRGRMQRTRSPRQNNNNT